VAPVSVRGGTRAGAATCAAASCAARSWPGRLRQRQAGSFQDCVQVAGRLLHWRRSGCCWRWCCQAVPARGLVRPQRGAQLPARGFDRSTTGAGSTTALQRPGRLACFDHWRSLGWRYFSGWHGGFRLLFEGVLGEWSRFRCAERLVNSDHGFGGSDDRRGFQAAVAATAGAATAANGAASTPLLVQLP